MKPEVSKKYVFFILFGALLILSGFIIKPYIGAILGSILLAYIFHPVYCKINKRLKNETISSFMTCIIVILIIILPIIFTANMLIKESINLYKTNKLENINEVVSNILGNNVPVGKFLEDGSKQVVSYLGTNASQMILSIPSKIFAFLIAIYILFYLLIHGEKVVRKIEQTFPYPETKHVLKYFENTTDAIVYGIFIVAFLEIIIVTVGFAIIGISTPLLWGVIIGFLALIPFLGPSIVWVPFTIIEYLQGEYGKAIGVLVIGLMLSISEMVVRSKLISMKSEVNPAIILIGILGGLTVFGFTGLIIGPLLLAAATIVLSTLHKYRFF